MEQAIRERVLGNSRIPSLPAVALQVLEITRSNDVDLDELAEVIQKDQALAGKVLRTVNSSYYSLSKPCANIRQSLVYLGMNTVRTLVLGFALVDSTRADAETDFDYMSYWRRSLNAAVAAREIALIHQRCDVDEAFLGSLMQDIGMVALHRVLQADYHPLVTEAGGEHRKLLGIERKALETDHAEIGGEIAAKWRLPRSLRECIEFHHDAEKASSASLALVQTVELGGLIAALLVERFSDSVMRRVARLSSDWFNIDARSVKRLLVQAGEATEQLGSLFRIKTASASDLDVILEEAEERLVEIQRDIERQNEELRQSNLSLKLQTCIDPLTGVANRKCFDETLTREFTAAREAGGCIGVIFCDADRFKSVNDTYGHQVGDVVLCEMAKRMQRIAGDRGTVARYGGEEFAIIIGGADRRETTRFAELIRREIEAAPIHLGSTCADLPVISITASLGAASLEPYIADLLTRPDLLVRLADQAVYAAKKSGRNCVRVYCNNRPRPEIAGDAANAQSAQQAAA